DMCGKDSDSGDIFLMHSGKIGGGRPGIGKSAFLAWSKASLIEVSEMNGKTRSGIPIAKLSDHNFAERVWAFVKAVKSFKDDARAGRLDTSAFKRRVQDVDRYRRDFSAHKTSARRVAVDYVTYHGDVVQKLYEERIAQAAAGEEVFNS